MNEAGTSFRKRLTLATIQMAVLITLTFGVLYGLTHTYLKHEEIPTMAMVISGLYFLIYDLTAMYLYEVLTKQAPKIITGFYLAAKSLRLFIAIVIIVLYGALEGPHVVAFAVNFFVFYMVTLIFITIHFVRNEKKNKKLHEQN